MRKKNSSFFKNIALVIVTVTPLLFAYLFTLQGVKELNAQKNRKLEELKEKETSSRSEELIIKNLLLRMR